MEKQYRNTSEHGKVWENMEVTKLPHEKKKKCGMVRMPCFSPWKNLPPAASIPGHPRARNSEGPLVASTALWERPAATATCGEIRLEKVVTIHLHI